MTDASSMESIELDNGEILDIFNKSRMIAKDTWLVALDFRIKIDIKKNIEIIETIAEENIIEMLGESVIYEAKHERNFIKENIKDQVLADMRDSFINTNLKYLSHPDFSNKFIKKKYNEKKKNR